MYRGDRCADVAQRFPSLIGCHALALNWPLVVDDDPDVIRKSVANLPTRLIRQARRDEIHTAGVIRFVLDNVRGFAERLPSGDCDEGQQNGVKHADDSDVEPGKIIVRAAYADVDQSMKYQQTSACGRGEEYHYDPEPRWKATLMFRSGRRPHSLPGHSELAARAAG